MDEAIRDLERRAASDPAAWPLLARARVRAGEPALAVLATVRLGLRVDPASSELARIRDEALARYWEAPRWRVLFEREGTGGDRVVFSSDGGLVAAAGRGVVVVDVEANRIAGGGYAGRSVRALAFLGRELLLDDEGLAHWDPIAGRERARIPGTIPTIAVAAAPDSSRGFAVTENGRVVRLSFQKGRVVSIETAQTLIPPPTAALAWAGLVPAEDRLILGMGNRLVVRSGPSFDEEQALLSGGPMATAMQDMYALLLRLAADSFERIASRIALAPDRTVALIPGPDGGVLAKFSADNQSVRTIESLPPSFRAAAFSPCGSRLAVLREDRLTLLEAC